MEDYKNEKMIIVESKNEIKYESYVFRRQNTSSKKTFRRENTPVV